MGEGRQYELNNIMEEYVKGEVRTAMKEIDMCQCDKCFNDVCAIVLNQVPPMYVTTPKGELLAKIGTMKRPQEIDMTLKVALACKMVNQRPLHDD